MSRKRVLIVGLVTVSLFSIGFISYALFVGTPRHPMTVEQADALVRHGLPLGARVSQVKTWLNAKGIEHSEYRPHHANGADGEILSIIRDTHRSLYYVFSDIQITFTFDKQHRLIGHSVHEALTGL